MSEKAVRNWMKLLAGCFSEPDLKFARRAFEQTAAILMFEEARASGAKEQEILSAIAGFLRNRGASNQEIGNEMQYAESFLKNVARRR